MRYAPYIGLLAVVLLIVSCFLPWAYYPDIRQTFTGFYSHENNYGKPGIALIFLGILIFVLLLIPRLWAKRAGQLVAIFILAYAIKSFVLFGSCYNGICPEKKSGLFLMLAAAVLILPASLFSGIKVPDEPENSGNQ
jgi:hypothetical protein